MTKEKQLNITSVSCYRYYNSGGINVVGIHIDDIKHKDGGYTFLTGRQPEYQWIRNQDLYDTYKEGKNAPVAHFYDTKIKIK